MKSIEDIVFPFHPRKFTCEGFVAYLFSRSYIPQLCSTRLLLGSIWIPAPTCHFRHYFPLVIREGQFTHLSDFRCRLEYFYIVPGKEKCNGCSKTSQTCTDNYDLFKVKNQLPYRELVSLTSSLTFNFELASRCIFCFATTGAIFAGSVYFGS